MSKKRLNNSISFNNFRPPLGLIADIKNGRTELETAKHKQINFKLDLNKLSIGNRKYKLKEKINALDNIKMLYNAREKEVIKIYDDCFLIVSKAKHEATKGAGVKMLTPKQMLQRLPIAFAQVKAGNN